MGTDALLYTATNRKILGYTRTQEHMEKYGDRETAALARTYCDTQTH